MQTVSLLPSPQVLSSSVTGASTTLRPVAGYVGVLTLVLTQTATTATPAIGSQTVELQGSLDGANWVVITSVSLASLTKPLGVTTDFGSGTGGYRSTVQIVQGMPIMRVCTSAALTNGAYASLSATFGNG